MRVLSWLKALVVGLFVLAAGSYAVYNSEWFQKKYLYPFPYQNLVYQYSLEHNLDPFLVAGLIRTESKFVPQAVSPIGALGLMQIMPETGQWLAGQIGRRDFQVQDLTDPETNIAFGTWYLASLKREFQDNEVLALAAYNGGRGNVRQWMRQYDWDMSFQDIRQIPFRETREYVTKVLRNKRRYQELYGK